mmetsp:Transcript_27483/g.30416  ORF Transcript_27483/g.30416 Transcript_27483/m.30416 type:complete len:97 (+) Transcript_27483:116-406(+)
MPKVQFYPLLGCGFLFEVLAWTARGYNNAEEDLLDTGFVRVANWNNGEWEKLGNDLMGQEAREFLGESIALSADGTIIAASAHVGGREYVSAYNMG